MLCKIKKIKLQCAALNLMKYYNEMSQTSTNSGDLVRHKNGLKLTTVLQYSYLRKPASK